MNPQPKIKRIIDEKYKAWIRDKSCITRHALYRGNADFFLCACGKCQAMHQNILGGTMGGKTHDILTLPGCIPHHTGDTCSDHKDPARFWEDTDKPRLILSYITEYASETGKTVDGMGFNLWLLKIIAENWGK